MSAASTTPRAAEPRARPDARSSAASSATSHARSTGCSPTRPRSHTARACASSAPDAGSPSTPQPKPSTRTPPASQHSNAAPHPTRELTNIGASQFRAPTVVRADHRSHDFLQKGRLPLMQSNAALARSPNRGRTPGVDAFGSSRWLASAWGRRRRGLLLVAVLAPVLGAEGYGVGVLVEDCADEREDDDVGGCERA